MAQIRSTLTHRDDFPRSSLEGRGRGKREGETPWMHKRERERERGGAGWQQTPVIPGCRRRCGSVYVPPNGINSEQLSADPGGGGGGGGGGSPLVSTAADSA